MPAGKTYIKIASQTLGSAASSVTFSNLPQNYTDLVIVCNTRVTGSVTNDDILVTLNGDTGANYSSIFLYGNGTSAVSGNNYNTSKGYWLYSPGANATASVFAVDVLNFNNYSNSTTYKTLIAKGSNTSNAELARTGLWRSTAAITSIAFNCPNSNLASGCTFTIYGIEASRAPKAIGGTVTTDGSYWIHTFTSSGTLIPQESIDNADYLVVAGGGGGGGSQGVWALGGGAGAGGLRSTVSATGGGGSLESKVNLSKDILYTVTVGAGGNGVTGYNSNGNNGSNSSMSGTGITTVTSTGGGGGKGFNVAGAAPSGGSGGGQTNGNSATAGGLGTANQGYDGGRGATYTGSDGGSGGGGGAGAVGANATTTGGGNGGAGVATSISGSSVTYAGGGGGAGSSTAGSGGSGGGGNGGAGSNANGSNATANTGGGGGGATTQSSGTNTGGNGGSGIVIVRYPV